MSAWFIRPHKLMLLPVGVVGVVVVLLLGMTDAQESSVNVTLKQGVISGYRDEAPNGYAFYIFKAIPYAKPPVGPLRFKDPEAATGWSGVRNGSVPLPKCPQASFTGEVRFMGQEDCLYLNVYTSNLKSDIELPVMVYIHGGGFGMGSGEDFIGSPWPLTKKGVVLVSINYRLGLLGFATTGDSVLPGNLGLKDQALALRWVQDNIREFGGDPNRVTIFGVSAGAISAHLLTLSPIASGLFHRAILQSGTALLLNHFISQRESTIEIMKDLDCAAGKESSQLFACLNETTTENLVTALSNASMHWLTKPLGMAPCVDGTFILDHPAILMRQKLHNKVDLMSGTTDDDGNVNTGGIMTENWLTFKDLSQNFTKIAPVMLQMTEEENPTYLTLRTAFNYLKNNTNFNLTRDDEFALTKMLTDRLFKSPNAQSVEFHARDPQIKTYMYQFDHHPEISTMEFYFNFTLNRKTAGHGDDMLYIFDVGKPMGPLTRLSDLFMRETMTTLWTNFAATGDPTSNGSLGFRWRPVAAGGPLHYLSLSVTPAMHTYDTRVSEFWNHLPTKANKLLFPERFMD